MIFLILDGSKSDTVSRVVDVTKTAGGKGLNVTRDFFQNLVILLLLVLVGGKLGEDFGRTYR